MAGAISTPRCEGTKPPRSPRINTEFAEAQRGTEAGWVGNGDGPRVLAVMMGKTDICNALGISSKSWGAIKKAGGKSLDSEGETKNTALFLEMTTDS